MQSFVLLVLLMTLVSCTDSGSRVQPPDLSQPPAAQPPAGTTISDPVPTPSPTATPVLPVTGITTVPQLGEDGSFEFGAWNIENFPQTDRTPGIVSEVIKRFNVDLMAFEEIKSPTDFDTIVRNLPGFKGVLSTHEYSNQSFTPQKLAFIYRQSDLDLLSSQLLFTDDDLNFPRPPLQARFRVKVGAHSGQEIYFIAVHLKATDEGKSQERREVANQKLEAYVASLANQDPNVQVVLLGDFNERANYDAGLNVFKPWLSKPESYTFQTRTLALSGTITYLSPDGMIDHLISTHNLEMNSITVPKLQTMIESYRDTVSDHLPVVARLR